MADNDILAEMSATLRSVHTEVTEVKTKQELHAVSTNTRLRKIEGHLEGNGQPGLKVRVDRLEQVSKWGGKLLWILVPILIGLIVSTLF